MSETTTWWKASLWDTKPTPVQVERATRDNVVLVEGSRTRRVGRSASYRRYFPSEEEAVGWLISGAMDRVASARRELQDANGALGNLKGKYPDHPAFRKGAATS